MPVVRTPDERFKDLPDFPFQPHYVEVDGMRIHYIDEGQGDNEYRLAYWRRANGQGFYALARICYQFN